MGFRSSPYQRARTPSDISASGVAKPPRAPRHDAAVAIQALQPGHYLTDGTNLYRSLGLIAGGRGQMVGLENCRSLDAILVPIGEIRTGQLRAVTPRES
jgi:hypothetical protein